MINTLFDNIFEDYSVRPYSTISDKGDFYQLKVELPGFSKDDVEVEVTDDLLNIETKSKDSKKKFSVKLMKKVYTENISCEMDKGLLLVELPKKGVVKPSKIKVN
tara:strand:+ start:2059 stop:2373 length:315 start_codon:yes stop_codon:yes gene_type:complete